MAKRKRETVDSAASLKPVKNWKEDLSSAPPKEQAARTDAPAAKSKDKAANNQTPAQANCTAKVDAPGRYDEGDRRETATIQIIAGSYERVLHGFTATFPQGLVTGPDSTDTPKEKEVTQPQVSFADTFLFNAHTSAIRCLALAPLSDESSKVTLATGSTDERINLYSLSTAPPIPSKNSKTSDLPTLYGNSIAENTKNKELGSLLHHSSSITALYFPSRSKLLSSAEDSTIAITRTRDWEPLSTIKAPVPKPQGRPSGDTAAPGEVPSGINDFAVHPSMKLMLSVGKGEKCLRLWNLVTGKKAGVLNFGREVIAAGGETRFGTGEGRKVAWDKEGEEFAVAFERGAVAFGIDCKPIAKVVPTPRTKLHQMQYLPSDSRPNTLVVSTEDGRIMFYDTQSTAPQPNNAKDEDISSCMLIAQLGGPAAGITGRIKDFEILSPPDADGKSFIIISGSSDGTVRIWTISISELAAPATPAKLGEGFTAGQAGKLIGTYSTGLRITCLKAFVMTGKPEEAEAEAEAEAEEDIAKSNSSSSSDSESE
ncbi:WD40 repeat-like protein [Lojkania enalia]|uniref:WD40 repeat-like protein n=1 Tax=Lojkania enalia TaxID=147567 RepID=A0A9P4K9K5_9PLEO|nr:WD40 repeat-like protein [Didymosphaeria enalia]